jgi:hypothetical protein
MRRERASRILELESAVTDAMKKLKERGFESPYLRPCVRPDQVAKAGGAPEESEG